MEEIKVINTNISIKDSLVLRRAATEIEDKVKITDLLLNLTDGGAIYPNYDVVKF